VNRWQLIVQHIERVSGQKFPVKQQQALAGGSINSAYLLSADNSRYFVKTNAPGRQDMFAAEARGLQALASSETLRVPKPVCFGDDSRQSYIVMEYLELSGRANQYDLGQQLAAMHRASVDTSADKSADQNAGQFGWDIDNTIGATHQPNAWAGSWLDFWRDQRLGYQLKLAANNGYGGELQTLGERLLLEMPKLFSGRDIKPSMLHGDLWGGNVAGLKDGTPVIFDPAFYYGDREADLAMTYVFGGFSADFYASYQNAFPLDDGFAVRKTFYNIYHIINHLNLFGGGYHGQSINMLEQVLAELR